MKSSQLLAALVGTCIAGVVHAQAYPNHPIRVVVPWPPGQATDLAARIVGDRLSQAMGQPFVMDNKPGAGGQIGTDTVAKAQPDGYTLLAASSGPVSIAPSLQKLPYAPLTDLAPVSVIAVNPFALVTYPSFPANNAKEFIAKLKAEPDQHTFASSGTGATAHLITAFFNSLADVRTRHIPYKGSVPALTDIMGGQVDYTFETVPSVVAHVKAGKLKTFGVSYTHRSAAMPDVPTIAEVTGLTGFNIGSWIGFEAPAGLPKEIAEKLSAEIKKAVASTATHERYLPLGLDQMANTPEEMAVMLHQEQDRFAAIVKKNNITIQ
ncbi:MAG TPA: tripartite tricarboxylate transporter substrate binding protein [Burkholderiales bacterium]|jgi:tripartite-type tricarboxylate transporter receptor subunit TctC|nr:tripartite tricarboxylate transporter substrate binding protein [Burkholderiales bacterium]